MSTAASEQQTPPSSGHGLRQAVLLIALTLAGQAAALSLADAPPWAAYLHYRDWATFDPRHLPWGVWLLSFQAAACGVLAWRDRVSLWRDARRLAPWWFLALTLGTLLFSAAIPMRSAGLFARELALSAAVTVVALANLVLAARALPAGALERTGTWLAHRFTAQTTGTPSDWDRRLPWAAAAFVLLVSGGIATFVFERIPHIDDEIAYYFQAKYMATGVLWLPTPPAPNAFGVAHLVANGSKWFGKFFFGWPAVLAVGVALGIPWLVSPLLGAASIVMTHRLVRRQTDWLTAHAVVALMCVSPWFLFMSGSFMAHPASLFWMLLAMVSIDCQAEARGRHWAALAGLSLGMVFLTRPLDAALVGPVIGLWAAGIGGRRLPLFALATVGIVAAIVAGQYFVYNTALTGHPLQAPHTLWSDTLFGPGTDVLGFGPHIGVPIWPSMDPLPGHGLPDVVINANKNMASLGTDLFGWAGGSLVLLVLAWAWKAMGRRDLVFAALPVAIIVGHCFYFFPGGPDIGPRYWYLALPSFALLTVRGAQYVAGRVDAPRQRLALMRVVGWMAIGSLGALLLVVPLRATTKYYRYRGIGRDVPGLAATHGITNALVFVRPWEPQDYQAAFIFNTPRVTETGNVYVRDVGDAETSAIVRHFPTRPVWLLGRRSHDAPLEVLAGPLAPGSALPPGERPDVELFQAVLP